MKRNPILPAIIAVSVFFAGCSRKHHPEKSASVKSKPDTVAMAKATARPKINTPVPKVITVDDKSAKRTFDGRYYYDLMGRRYWKNNKDGKYYIYNKSMHNNPDFQKP